MWSKSGQIDGLTPKALITGKEILIVGKTYPTPGSLHIYIVDAHTSKRHLFLSAETEHNIQVKIGG
jgi:hypothetical protein